MVNAPDEPQTDQTISRKRILAKRLKHECRNCREPSLPDSDFCGPHRDGERARLRAAAKKRREGFRHKGRCVDCGRRSKTWRCKRCYRISKGVTDKEKVVTPPPQGGTFKRETGTHAWGSGKYETERYIGHARRGRLTLVEQAEEDKRDARFARAELDKFDSFLDDYIALPLKDMPRIQREAKRREALVFLGNARRFIEELEDKYGG